MRQANIRIMYQKDAVNASFVTEPLPLDPDPMASIQLVKPVQVGLNGSAIVQASLDGINWSDLTGTQQSISAAGPLLWVLSDIGGIRMLRLSVTISAGMADFKIMGGVG